jgi:hypothetical protein
LCLAECCASTDDGSCAHEETDDDQEPGDSPAFLAAVKKVRQIVETETSNKAKLECGKEKKRRYRRKRKSAKGFYNYSGKDATAKVKNGHLPDGEDVEQDSDISGEEDSGLSRSLSSSSRGGGRKKLVSFSTLQLTGLIFALMTSCCFTANTFKPEPFAYSRFKVDGMSSVHHFVAERLQSAGPGASPVFSCDGVQTCHKCFLLYFGISSSTWYRVKSLTEDGTRTNWNRKKGNKDKQLSTTAAIAWMNGYASIYGDFQPDFEEVHIPDIKWKHLYAKYTYDMKRQKMVAVSLDGFTKMCHKYVGWVRLRQWTRFSQCDDCHAFNESINLAKTSTEKLLFRLQKDVHKKWQGRERAKYHKHRAKAMRYPDKYMSINFDGMDHSKTSLPAFKRESKLSASLERLNVHVTGVLVHNHELRAYVYTWLDNFPADSNISIHVILDVILRMQKKGPLPPTLYIQADNCCRENKNKFLLGFLHILVERKVFKKIKLSFLPKGHTHEDVDQMFSRFAVALRGTHVTTVPELHKVFHEEYQPNPTCIHLSSLPCYNKYLLPFLDNIEGHTTPAVFIVKRGQDGIVRHHFKLDMQTRKIEYPTCILPRNRLGLQLFEKHGFPSMSATAIPCVPWRSVRLKQLGHTAAYLSRKDWITPKTNRWWTKMLETQEDDEFNRCPECKRMRDLLALTSKDHRDSDFVRKAKGRERYKWEKALGKHLIDFTTGYHKAYPLQMPTGSDFMAPLPVVSELNIGSVVADPDPDSESDPLSDSQPGVNLPDNLSGSALTMQQCLQSESEVDNHDIFQHPPPAILPDPGGFGSASERPRRGKRARTSRHFSPPDRNLSFVESGSASETHFSGTRTTLQKKGLPPLKVTDLVMVIPPIDGGVEGLLNSSGWEYWLKRPFWLGKVMSIDPSSSEAKFTFQIYGMPQSLWMGKYLPGWIDKSNCTKDNQIPQEIYTKNACNRPAVSMHSDGESVYYWFDSLTKGNLIPKKQWDVISRDPRYIARCKHLDCSTERI